MMISQLISSLSHPEKVVDPLLKPIENPQQKKLAWLGLETQVLTPLLAKIYNVSLLTSGGKIGLLVNDVIPLSPS